MDSATLVPEGSRSKCGLTRSQVDRLELNMDLYKSRPFLSNLAAMLRGELFDARQDTKEIRQLREAIIEHGQMAYQLYLHQPVRIEVKELAFRFRETPHNIVTALILLEEEGWAQRTKYRGLWYLRVPPQNSNREVIESQEDQRRL